MISELYDVIVVGYGPGGEVAVSTLGAAGVRVLVVERWPQPYPLPRLTTLCGECCRVIQATGKNVEAAFSHTLVSDSCNFVDADGEPVLTVPYSGKLGGWPSRVSMFQPDIEKAIAEKVEAMPNVTLLRGWEATEMWQESDEVHLIVSPSGRAEGSTSGPRTVRAKYLVGADGTRSSVRQMACIPMDDYGLHERWLNFDAELVRPLPEKFMTLRIFMDPERPHMYMPIGKRGLRMEFRVMEGETDEWATTPAVTDEFMLKKYGLTAADVRIMRRVVYHYRTRLASKWSHGRVFLVGDAAHTMPPYMGQGAAAAIRDGRNLAWKLVEVLSGRSDQALLNEYQVEREPHITTIQNASSALSNVVNVTDPVKAAARNNGMREEGVAKPPQLPNLTSGALFRSADGGTPAPAGHFTPQGTLRRNGAVAMGDDILGDRFQLWTRRDPGQFMGVGELVWLKQLGCTIAVFEDATSRDAVVDVEGVYREFMDHHRVDVMLLRPDFYAFGGVNERDANEMVRQLAERLYSKTSPRSAAGG
ncbi:bifunctional 3-(3-hydroxy-phenyl)propionate/3-hydroxycinnamic acid hydroxylase [Noviherbaspirillum saxi]|uniref:bifunctional 3-(3-hydroxy-phenyl)propionate/3-hydroxycinnamic acid hydroxylase n=1 Tax=Noviherbaspirillum saxi TaxID=2320863 RepID=UPI00131472A4|nr:bifunctional 3-(3-hydroxy-phenyl)propionate/3-hydroxycinnamic acid hydroxylase [Noviherbaspirillum saxi]